MKRDKNLYLAKNHPKCLSSLQMLRKKNRTLITRIVELLLTLSYSLCLSFPLFATLFAPLLLQLCFLFFHMALWFICLPVFLSLSLSLCLSLCFSVPVSLYVTQFLCLSAPFSLCVFLSPLFPIFLCYYFYPEILTVIEWLRLYQNLADFTRLHLSQLGALHYPSFLILSPFQGQKRTR